VSTPSATVVVTTKDRRADLERLLPTLFAQSVACEVLIVDDGSTDGTAEMVRTRFPAAKVERSEASLGYIVQRTRAAELATAPVIVSVDDDAVLPSTRTVEQTLADFDHPRIGAVAIPFDDVRPDGTAQLQRPPDRDGRWLTAAYVGTAHAVRRDIFLAVGGYRASLLHQVEELDYCMRMLAAGYVTRIGRADPLQHLESPKRNRSRLITQTVRNEWLHGWHNVPMPYLPVRWAKVAATAGLIGVRWRAPGPAARGLWRGFGDSIRLRADRDPVPRALYLVHHTIRKNGPLRLEDVELRLPPIEDLRAPE
jgi:glycosyltransferase involved in cell wall biosynthesis